MRVVCDTNVLIAGLVAEGLCRDIVKRRLPAVELFSSQALLDELGEKLRDKFGVNPDELPLLNAYRDKVVVVRPRPLPQPICRDSDDDRVLATAIAAQAEVILTGDDDLLVLKKHQGIRIVSPRQFVSLLDQVG